MRVTLLAVALSLLAGAARADIYGYVDERGVIHFSNFRADERYTLFFKDGERFDSARLPRGPAGSQSAQVLPVDPLPNLEATPLLDAQKSRFVERVMEHPNLKRYEALIAEVAREHGLDAALLQSVIAVESGYQPDAVSPKGAIGLMQVIPATGERYGLRGDARRSLAQKLSDPLINLRIGARYLVDLRKMFADDLDLVLAAYNAGENAVKRYRNAIPPFPETQGYVKLVREFYRFLKPPAPVVRAPEVNAPAATAALPRFNRVQMTIAARRNMPDPGRVPQGDALRVPPGTLAEVRPDTVLQVPPLSSVEAIEVPALADAHESRTTRPVVSGLQ